LNAFLVGPRLVSIAEQENGSNEAILRPVATITIGQAQSTQTPLMPQELVFDVKPIPFVARGEIVDGS
jgi:hypothetical protein